MAKESSDENPIDSGKSCALDGTIQELCDEYDDLESFHRALTQKSNELQERLGIHKSKKEIEKEAKRNEQSKPHFDLINYLNEHGFGELSIIFEYVIPGSTLRADAVIVGERSEKNYALILEIKSWKESKWGMSGGFISKYNSWHINASGHLAATPRKTPNGDDETAADGSPLYELKHPLYQALTYRNLITLFHDKVSHTQNDKVAHTRGWYVNSACFIPGITDYSFLYLGEASQFSSKKDEKGDNDNKASFIYNRPEEVREALEHVTASGEACKDFLNGSFAIPRGKGRGTRNNKVVNPLHDICVAIAGSNESAGIDLRSCILSGMLKQIEQHKDKAHISNKLEKTVIVANIQQLLDYRARDGVPLFVNAADIALLLQDTFLRDGQLAIVFGDSKSAEVSVQTSTESLLDLKALLRDDGRLSNASKRVVHAFDEINLEHPSFFNVFSACKWSNAVCTRIGIIDFCSGSRAQTEDKKKLASFLRNSVEAKTIFLLVDDGTKSVKGLKDGESIQDFTIVKWPTD